MNSKKLLAAGLAAVVLATMVGASFTYAENDNDDHNDKANKSIKSTVKTLEKLDDRLERGSEWVMKSVDMARAVQMKDNGEFHVKGAEVVSVNASSGLMTARLYGLTREVNVAGAKLHGNGRMLTLADFQAGDKIAAWGKYDESTRVISVTEVKNFTPRSANNSAIQQRIEELRKMIQELLQKVRSLGYNV